MVEVLYFNRVIALLQGCLTGYFTWCMKAIVVDDDLTVDIQHTSVIRAEVEGIDTVFRNVDVAIVS